MGSILGGALDIVGNAGNAIMSGLNQAQQTILSIPDRIVQTGQDLGSDLGQHQQPVGSYPQQPQEDKTALYIAGGVAVLLVVILLTRQ